MNKTHTSRWIYGSRKAIRYFLLEALREHNENRCPCSLCFRKMKETMRWQAMVGCFKFARVLITMRCFSFYNIYWLLYINWNQNGSVDKYQYVNLNDLGSSPRSGKIHIIFQNKIPCFINFQVHHMPPSSRHTRVPDDHPRAPSPGVPWTKVNALIHKPKSQWTQA